MRSSIVRVGFRGESQTRIARTGEKFARDVVPDQNGAVAHAQLVLGDAIIMLGAATNNEFHKLVKSPLESGGIGSPSVYMRVSDVDGHYQQAVVAGAGVAIELKTEEQGGRSYSCRYPEGYIWNFGSYYPWAV